MLKTLSLALSLALLGCSGTGLSDLKDPKTAACKTACDEAKDKCISECAEKVDKDLCEVGCKEARDKCVKDCK